MLKSIGMTGAVVLAVAAWAAGTDAQPAKRRRNPDRCMSMRSTYDIAPGQIDNFLAALKENAAASVKEPGCREFNILVSQKDPNHVLIFEVYDDAAAARGASRRPITSRNTRRRPRHGRQA